MATVGIREAKMRLSKYLKMVQHGQEVILTDRGRPVGKIVPVRANELSLKERLLRLTEQGVLASEPSRAGGGLPPLVRITGGMAQQYLQEDRENG
ncbi:MAG: type II toxin-antitoxin system Phd/YefM family antitoxin [Dissulfuribacterales bacterium]